MAIGIYWKFSTGHLYLEGGGGYYLILLLLWPCLSMFHVCVSNGLFLF